MLHIKSKRLTIPNLQVQSYLDSNKPFNQCHHKTRRQNGLNLICLHHNRGMIPGMILPGTNNIDSTAISLAKYQARKDTRKASWDFTIGTNNDIYQSNLPEDFYTWNCNQMNRYSIGIELVQQHNKPWELYQNTIDSAVLLIDVLTYVYGIQRQILSFDSDKQVFMDHKLEVTETRSSSLYGLLPHKSINEKKGPGDCSNHLLHQLKDNGYEIFNAEKGEELEVWKDRQKGMGVGIDGLPGMKTREAIKRFRKNKSGLWIRRPIDHYLDMYEF